jgi:4-amino-4-deoxy-L-arabinose transferase-like glycosyltransferase
LFVAPGAWGEGEEYAKRVAVVGGMNPTTCRRVLGGPGVTRPRALPYLARYVMLVCAAVTSLLLFFFGASVATPATGLIASQLLLLHPFMVHANNRTMSDPVALMFGTAAAFAVWKLLKLLVTADTSASITSASITSASITSASITSASTTNASTTNASTTNASTTNASTTGAVKAALLAGVLLALACGAKMNSLIVVFLFAAAVAVAATLAWRKGDKKKATLALGAGAASLGLALALFVLINPAILFDPWNGLVALFREPQLNTAIQARVMFQLHLTELGEKFAAMATIAGGSIPFLLVAIVALLACVKAKRIGMWFVAGWWAIAVACVTAWIPFDWSRYMLPILPSVALLVAHAMVVGAVALQARGRRSVITGNEAV